MIIVSAFAYFHYLLYLSVRFLIPTIYYCSCMVRAARTSPPSRSMMPAMSAALHTRESIRNGPDGPPYTSHWPLASSASSHAESHCSATAPAEMTAYETRRCCE